MPSPFLTCAMDSVLTQPNSSGEVLASNNKLPDVCAMVGSIVLIPLSLDLAAVLAVIASSQL